MAVAPPNTTPATAIDVASLPYMNVQRVDDGSTVYDVWYKFRAQPGQLLLGCLASSADLTSTYVPELTVYEDAGSTTYLNLTQVAAPFQMPTTVATTYYFKIAPDVSGTPAQLRVQFYGGPQQPIPAGSILINDDTEDFPGILVGPNVVLNTVSPFPSGESGDVLETGEFIVYDDPNNTLHIYDNQLNPVTTSTGINLSSATTGCVRTCLGTGRWWFTYVNGSNEFAARYITKTGTLGTEHEMLAVGSTMVACAANNDETILYWANRVTNTSALKRWNLSTDTAMADLVAGDSGYQAADIFVLNDGTILMSYIAIGDGTVEARRYNAAGVLQNTYSLGTTEFPSGTLPRLASDPSGDNFWVWLHPETGVSRFQQIALVDGAVRQSFDINEFSGGVSESSTSAGFGVSFSCPMIVTRTAITASNSSSTLFVESLIYGTEGYSTEDVPIIVDRITPTLNSEQLRVRYPNLVLEIQPGVGLSTGQGENPLIMLRISDDGGQTWGNEITATMGELGHYGTRTIFRRLGQARNRVYWLRVSDPVFVGLLAAYHDPQRGVS